MADIFDDYRYAYIEFYVGMAKMVAYWHVKALGFHLTGYRGPETGSEEVLSFLLEKNGIRLVITSAAKPSAHNVLSFIDRHGNGVKRIGLYVNDAEEAWRTAIDRGGIPMRMPNREENDQGHVTEGSIRLFDRTEITFFNDDHYEGLFRPGFEPRQIVGFEPEFDNGFQAIDHLANGLHTNEMAYWRQYFQNIFNSDMLQELKSGDMVTEYSGMLLNLIGSPNRKVHDVFVEPENRARPSQVQEYIENFVGSGVQHMAFSTDNIFETVRNMRSSGIDFVTYPKAYYDNLRLEGNIPEDLIDTLEECAVLCDAQEDSYLFQTFTKPFGDRPTFFYEVIQRTNTYEGFALDNITALFKAVEGEQAKRMGEKELV